MPANVPRIFQLSDLIVLVIPQILPGRVSTSVLLMLSTINLAHASVNLYFQDRQSSHTYPCQLSI